MALCMGCIGDLAAQVILGLYQNEACYCTTVVQASFCGHVAKVSILCMSSLFLGDPLGSVMVHWWS